MKKKFEKILKEIGLGLSILNYHTYRSDMGCQVFDILVGIEGKTHLSFSDSYFVGENKAENHDKILKEFTSEVLKAFKHNQ